MRVDIQTTTRRRDITRLGLAGGFLLAMALVIAAMTESPPTPASPPYLAYGLAALIALLAVGGAALLATRTKTPEAVATLRRGTLAGLIGGALWVVEIAYNNLLAPLAPTYNTANIRDAVDNVFWLAVVLVTLAFAAREGYRARRIGPGVRVGAWSGLVSGLAACLMGLLLVAAFVGALTSDPLAIAEYAQRGAARGAPDIAHYVAYDTMAGALGHLILLGVLQGALLGLVAGALGAVLARSQSGGSRTPPG